LGESSRSTDSDRSGLDDASLRAIEPRQPGIEPDALLKVADAGQDRRITDPARLRAPTLAIVCEAWLIAGVIESKGSWPSSREGLVLTVF